jgi:hypothetical protein
MNQLRKRVSVRRTPELEISKEAVDLAMKKIQAVISGESNDLEGAKAAKRVLSAHVRLEQQRAIQRAAKPSKE